MEGTGPSVPADPIPGMEAKPWPDPADDSDIDVAPDTHSPHRGCKRNRSQRHSTPPVKRGRRDGSSSRRRDGSVSRAPQSDRRRDGHGG